MPSSREKKTRPRRDDARVTPPMVSAFLRGDHAWLRRTLGLMPWENTPAHALEDGPHDMLEGTAGWESDCRAMELRLEILRVIQYDPRLCHDAGLQRAVAASIAKVEKLREGRR